MSSPVRKPRVPSLYLTPPTPKALPALPVESSLTAQGIPASPVESDSSEELLLFNSSGELPLSEDPYNQAIIEEIRTNIRSSGFLSPRRSLLTHPTLPPVAASTYQHEYAPIRGGTLRIVNPDSAEVETEENKNNTQEQAEAKPASGLNLDKRKSLKQVEDENIQDIIGELNKVKLGTDRNPSRARRRSIRKKKIDSPEREDPNPCSEIDMALFPAFLDNPGALNNHQTNNSYIGSNGSMNHQIPRQAPSPGHGNSQQMPNGINGGLGGGAGGAGPGGMGGPNVNVLNAAGHQSDLNLLWGMVNELSAELQKNREATQEMIDKAQLVRARAAAEGVDGILRDMNGELSELDNAALESEVTALRAEVSSLQTENNDLASLLADYESSLEKIMEMLRRFAHERTLATLAIHRQYSAELATERSTILSLRQEHAEWQGRLVGLSTLLREALSHQVDSEEESGAGVEFAALRAENRSLRRLVGLPTEEDDEEGEGEGEGRRVGREWDLGDGGQ